MVHQGGEDRAAAWGQSCLVDLVLQDGELVVSQTIRHLLSMWRAKPCRESDNQQEH